MNEKPAFGPAFFLLLGCAVDEQTFAVVFQPPAVLSVIRTNLPHEVPEPRPVVHLDPMRSLVGGDIAQNLWRGEGEAPVENGAAIGRAATPAAPHLPYADGCILHVEFAPERFDRGLAGALNRPSDDPLSSVGDAVGVGDVQSNGVVEQGAAAGPAAVDPPVAPQDGQDSPDGKGHRLRDPLQLAFNKPALLLKPLERRALPCPCGNREMDRAARNP